MKNDPNMNFPKKKFKNDRWIYYLLKPYMNDQENIDVKMKELS